MAGTYTYKSPAYNSPSTKQSKDGSATGKNRIYQVFEKTFELDELSIPAETTGDQSENLQNRASLQYPVIKINDYMINQGEIDSMEIDCKDWIPKITLKCTFIHQTFLTREMPKDGDIISIAIRNKSDLLKSVRNDYVITGVVSTENTTQFLGPTSMTFYGVLFIPWLSSGQLDLSFEGTSFETLKDLSKKIGLGFATNEDNTDDKQIWIAGYHYTTAEFINSVSKRIWRDEKSFYDIWIDIYYNLNFINVNKQLMSSEDEVDLAGWINNIDKEYVWGNDAEQSKVIETPKVLSNYDGYRTTSFYINSWRPINKATNITFECGTRIQCNMFEHNDKLYSNEEAKQYWSFPIDPAYDPAKVNKYILLRGRAKQYADLKGKDQAKANYSYTDMYVKYPWSGIQYTISNPNDESSQWDGNVHKNYLRAKIQNLINNKELEKLNVEVTVNGINLNIIKGDKTPIVLVRKDIVENRMINKDSGDLDMLEEFYSGWLYVKGFTIKYNKENDDTIMSNFTQTFILTRREWPPPIAVDAINPTENKTTT